MIPLHLGEVLVEAGREIPTVYFPCSGIISSIVNLKDGERIEVSMIGRDGVCGAAAVLGGDCSPTAAIVQFPGTATVISSGNFRHAYSQSSSLRSVLAQRQWVDLMEAETSAACNACHPVEERMCRRLLRMHDLTQSATLPVTQEALASMLGVRRNSISIAAGALQSAGIIKYTRGQIRIANLHALIDRSCECYQAVKTRPQVVRTRIGRDQSWKSARPEG